MYGSKLKELRNLHGISQGELAEKIGITQAGLSKLESSEYPDLAWITKICKYFKEPLPRFFSDSGEDADKYNIPVEYIDFVKDFLAYVPENKRLRFLKLFKEQISLSETA